LSIGEIASKYFYYTFYNYQKVLADLSRNLVRVLELDKLASLITHTLIKTMKLDKAGVLLRDPKTKSYRIQKIIGFKKENGISLVKDNFLTIHLEKTKKPVVFGELSLAIRDAKNQEEKGKLEKLRANMKRIEAELCLPLFLKEKLLGIIVLGRKLNGEPYSRQDLELLISLSHQSSLALQNAKLYSQIKDFSKNLEEKVKEQVKDIEELSAMKSEFLKVVNHQLRTPASIIKGMSSMLAEGSVPKQQREDFIKKLYLSSERLTLVLDDILLAQSLVGGLEKPEFSPCRIEEIVEKEINHLKPQTEAKNLKILFEKPKKPLPLVLIDPEMIERVVYRLIDNAILYTRKGEIKISINLKKEKDKNFIEISIKDQGLGLDEKDKKNLFNLFYRGKRAVSLHPNGSGLGLFIVKKLIEAHQGTITAESAGKDRGAVFTLVLPMITKV